MERLDIPVARILEEWIPSRFQQGERPVPPMILGWLRMTSLQSPRRSTSDADGNPNFQRDSLTTEEDTVAADSPIGPESALECFTDKLDDSIVLVRTNVRGLPGSSGRLINLAVLWTSADSDRELRTLFQDVLSSIGNRNPMMFVPLAARFLPALIACAPQAAPPPGRAYAWRPTPASYTQTLDLPDDVILDVARDGDVDDMVSLSSIGMPRPFYEKHVHQYPFRALNCVVRSKETGRAMSFAFTYEDFSIALVGTKEEFRGRGLARIAILEVLKKQRSLGQDQPFAMIDTKNTSSQSTFSKAGFEKDLGNEYLWCFVDVSNPHN